MSVRSSPRCDEQASVPAIQRLRAAAIDLLCVRLGHRLAELGCGTGDLARALAGRVGPTGSVLGIDASETMLAEARRRAATTTLPVEFRHGDITNLDLDDASFDGTVCERVLQHLHSPLAAIAELVRITRPGGRVVVIDTDWGLHAINGADPALTAQIIGCWAEQTPNALVGRELAALCCEAGLADLHIVAETMTSTDPGRPLLAPFPAMAAAAVHSNAISATDAQIWLDQLAYAGRRGRFFWALTIFAVAVAVAGARPGATPDHDLTSTRRQR